MSKMDKIDIINIKTSNNVNIIFILVRTIISFNSLYKMYFLDKEGSFNELSLIKDISISKNKFYSVNLDKLIRLSN